MNTNSQAENLHSKIDLPPAAGKATAAVWPYISILLVLRRFLLLICSGHMANIQLSTAQLAVTSATPKLRCIQVTCRSMGRQQTDVSKRSIKYVCCSGARAASTAEQAEAPQDCLEESAECPVRNDADEGSSQVNKLILDTSSGMLHTSMQSCMLHTSVHSCMLHTSIHSCIVHTSIRACMQCLKHTIRWVHCKVQTMMLLVRSGTAHLELAHTHQIICHVFGLSSHDINFLFNRTACICLSCRFALQQPMQAF